MQSIKFVKNVFPESLLKEIQSKTELFDYAILPATVCLDEIVGFNNLIDSIDYIKDIAPNVCMMYNDYYSSSDFSFIEGLQLFEAFKHFMPEEFVGYKLKRFHANLSLNHPNYPNDKHTIPHYDSPDNSESEYKTILFYVNSSDGNTILFNEFGDYNLFLDNNLANLKLTIAHEQSPIENCALIYSSNRIHAHRPPTISNKRIVLNIVLEKL